MLVSPRLLLAQTAAADIDSQGAAGPSNEYTVGAQDVLEVTVFGESEISGKFEIEADGTFNFPMIGRVRGAGLTLRAIERELHRRLADGYLQNPQVSVSVGQFRSQRIFVLGEVSKPGAYPLTAEMTLIEALATAGSVSNSAAHHVVILRGTRKAGDDPANPGTASEVIQVGLGAFQNGSLVENAVLRDGDIVMVPRVESVYILGQVRSPGAFAIEKDTTVLQAIAMAGGVTDRASMSRIKIVRIVNGKKTEIKAGVDDAVKPGDTVMVMERFF